MYDLKSLLDFLLALASEEDNLRQLVDDVFVNIIIKYASLAHLNPDQIGNVLARLSGRISVLLLTNNSKELSSPSPSSISFSNKTTSTPTSASALNTTVRGGGDESPAAKASTWIPNDAVCPAVWCVAARNRRSRSTLPEREAQLGPFRVSELLHELEEGNITMDSLVAPISTEESEAVADEATESFHNIVDTGRWKPLKDYFQLRIQMLFPGKAQYSPAQVALKSIALLQSVAAVHKYANSKG